MRNLGKVLRTSNSANWEQNLEEYLRNYRATPHTATRVSPNKLMFRTKNTTTKLPNYKQLKHNNSSTTTRWTVQSKDGCIQQQQQEGS
jgi:hypothetical protein